MWWPDRILIKVVSATQMPFDDNSVAAFIMFDVFHHIKHCEQALLEIKRCLKPWGKIIMIEPNNSLWGRFIYKNFYHEHFDANRDWGIEVSGRLSDANIALPWIVFIRDKKIFENKLKNGLACL